MMRRIQTIIGPPAGQCPAKVNPQFTTIERIYASDQVMPHMHIIKFSAASGPVVPLYPVH